MPTPERTSRAAIVSAACDILEDSGPAGLTMKAVADRVGVRPPSLYKRVADRSALLGLVAEHSATVLTNSLAGAGSIAELATKLRKFAHSNPEAFKLIFFTDHVSLPALEAAAAPLMRLVTPLVGQDSALSAARFVTAWAVGFVSMEITSAFHLGDSIEDAFEYGVAQVSAALTQRAVVN